MPNFKLPVIEGPSEDYSQLSAGLPVTHYNRGEVLLSAITDAGTDEQLELLREQIRTLVGTDRAAAIDAFTNRKAALTAKETNE